MIKTMPKEEANETVTSKTLDEAVDAILQGIERMAKEVESALIRWKLAFGN